MSVVPASSSQLKFFVDRSLGKQVAQLLRKAGFDLITLDEYYGDSEGDEVAMSTRGGHLSAFLLFSLL